MAVNTNNPPDIELRLTHEQGAFLLENCDSNVRMGSALIMSMADDPSLTQMQKIERADKIESMRKKFTEIMKLLRDAGAREKED